MVTPLTATQTSDRARSALRSGKGAGLPELLKLIEALTTDLANATISDIADLIEQDAAVMSRLLTVANTIVHNPHIAPLSSVPNAIHRVGFQRIRSLAVSLMLLENTGGTNNPPEQCEAAAHALCAGLMAQGCAQAFGTVDPEVAFACATLRQLGHIVLPGVSLEHYREAQQRLKIGPEDIAYSSVFGITPIELSRVLLADSRLPVAIMRGLGASDPEMVATMLLTDDARLLGIADFGGRLARQALDASSNYEGFDRKSRLLARQYERLLPGASALIEPALLHTDERLAGFTRTGVTHVLPSAIMLRIRSRVRRKAHSDTPPQIEGSASAITDAVELTSEPPGISTADAPPEISRTAPLPLEPMTAAARSTDATAASESAGPTVPEENWAEQLQRSTAFATQQTQPKNSADPWVVASTALRHSFEADQVWVFLPEISQKNLVLTHWTDGNWKELRVRPMLRHDERTVFGVCISRRQTVTIHDTGEPNIQRYLPEWYWCSEDRPGAFLIMPLTDGNSGLVLIGWTKPRQVAPTAGQTELAHLLLSSAAMVRQSNR